MDLEKIVETARGSNLFTAPVLGPHLERFLNEQGSFIQELAGRAVTEGVQHIYWVGCGNSWVNLYNGKYLLDKFTNLTSDWLTAYEFVWRNPTRLGKKAWVFISSYSGATEDAVVALRHANRCGATTIAIVNQADSLMGREANTVIPYNSKALYILPLAAVCLFALEVARLQGAQGMDDIAKNLYSIPALLNRQYIEEEIPARKLAEEYVDEHIFYTLGSGPLFGLAYKFGLTVFMENMRVNGSFIETTEFRHGPVEMFDREKPAIVILRGTDESRPVSERVEQVCSANGAHVLVYDAARYPEIHPLLSPFALMIPLQWFAVWSSLMRGIEDMDARVLMGRGILGKGQGVTWP